MAKTSLTLALLSLALTTLAVDIDMFPDDAKCDGDDFITCENIAAGECCYSDDEIFESCEANMPSKPIQAFSVQDGDFCKVLLGGSDLCWGVSDEIARITGCKWNEPAAKRDVGEEEGSCKDGGVKPNFLGRRIGARSYLLDLEGQGYQEYRNLTSSEEKGEFLMRKADKIREH